jgi:transcriptional regulator with XRE-family HTH domain
VRSPRLARRCRHRSVPRLKLRAARIENGYDQRLLASRIDREQPYVSDLELGRRDPSPEEVKRLTRILGTAAEELFPDLTHKREV